MDLDCKEVERLKELVPYKILAPTPNEIINYIEQLQSNWNSLREYIKENGFYERQDIIDAICNPNEDKLIYIDDVLDKMNELEGVNNSE